MTNSPDREINRREFIGRTALGVAAGAAAGAVSLALGPRLLRGDVDPSADSTPPQVADHTLSVITGNARERGRQYARDFSDAIRSFVEREIYQPFISEKQTKEDTLRYAGACAKEVKAFAPTVHDELEGIAEGTGLTLDEVTLITLHEELWHRGVLPPTPHCTAIAAGPPDTNDGSTYVGQTWDWMPSVYGLSSMLLWRRPEDEGPSVLAYSYPGLWTGAGMNSAGVALCWTSGPDEGSAGPRVGIPSYVLIAQMLYQPTLEAALAEAKRAKQAGWFTFVLADGEGNLANAEGSPKDSACETGRGHLARAYFGSRKMTGTAEGQAVQYHPRCRRMYELLDGKKGRLDRAALQGLFGTHGSEGKEAICVHPNTLDAMLFDCTCREAWVTRGPACSGRWKRFGFDDAGA